VWRRHRPRREDAAVGVKWNSCFYMYTEYTFIGGKNLCVWQGVLGLSEKHYKLTRRDVITVKQDLRSGRE